MGNFLPLINTTNAASLAGSSTTPATDAPIESLRKSVFLKRIKAKNSDKIPPPSKKMSRITCYRGTFLRIFNSKNKKTVEIGAAIDPVMIYPGSKFALLN